MPEEWKRINSVKIDDELLDAAQELKGNGSNEKFEDCRKNVAYFFTISAELSTLSSPSPSPCCSPPLPSSLSHSEIHHVTSPTEKEDVPGPAHNPFFEILLVPYVMSG